MVFNLHTDTMFRYNYRTFRVTSVWRRCDEVLSVEFEQGAIVNGIWTSSKDVEPHNKFYSLLKKLMIDGDMEFIGVYKPKKDAAHIAIRDSKAKEKFAMLVKKNSVLQILKDTFDLEII